MGTLLAIHPDGLNKAVPSPKLDLKKVYELIGNGCDTVERVKVRWEGRLYDCWLDEEGWIKPNVPNRRIKELVRAAYPNNPVVQDFAGVGVIWIPKGLDISDPAVCRVCGYPEEECECPRSNT